MSVTPSKIFTVACISFIAGIFVCSLIPISIFYAAMLIFLAVLFLVGTFPLHAKWGSKVWLLPSLGIFILMFVFGGGAISLAKAEKELKYKAIEQFIDKESTIEGTVDNYPDVRMASAHIVVKISSVDGQVLGQEFSSRILIYTDRFYDYAYGNKLIIKGKLRAPEPFNNFDYPSYLAKDNIFAVISKPEIITINKNEPDNILFSYLFNMRQRLDRSVMSVLPFREAGVLKAILFGDEGAMSEDFKTKLNQAGLRHIVAISGMNITLIASILMTAFLKMGLWRRHAFSLATAAIFLFVLMIGAPASAMRAAIFGVFVRFQEIIGRLSNAVNITLLAAILMLTVNPLVLRWDLSFQLSFLAVLGLILFTPMFMRVFKWVPDKFILRDTLAMTFAAQLATFPLLISSFNNFSLITPLSNVLIVPLLPAITIAGVLLAILNLFIPPLAVILATPLLLVMKIVYFITELFGSINPVTLRIDQAAAILFGIIYLIFMFWLIWYERNTKKWPIGEMEEFNKTYGG